MPDEPLSEQGYIEWLHKLKKSIKSGIGADISEASRMVFSFVSIISGYRKKFWESINKVGLADVFLTAIDRIDEIINAQFVSGDGNPDRNLLEYRANIKQRYDEIISMCFPKEKADESAG